MEGCILDFFGRQGRGPRVEGGSAKPFGPARARERRPIRARGRGRDRSGGPGAPRGVPGGAHMSAARFTVGRAHAAGWRTVDRAREGGEGRRRLTRSQPTWLRRGCHAGQREEEEGEAGNERRTAAEFTGARHDLSGKREHTGEEGRDERKRADGLDSPERGRRRRIAATHAGGEKKGKRRRGDKD
ncbi:Epstein-Barr virus EBNA-1-like [Oryza sativa Japonica Group]|uniref:Epstein-Barr virus EBNA-1-like n=1 Tax=Oryza sativa subsp. japonica TaxID=39947 RepID=Q8GT10_ORYSJ|nr:Epstein-Barr virus EBNA-1-like [Oryza sativa Japonica Group]